MKRVILLLVLALMFSVTLTAQTTYKVGKDGQLIGTSVSKTVSKPVKTEYTVTIKDITYPVYVSAKGKYFIIRTSKNTGKEYKQYIQIES